MTIYPINPREPYKIIWILGWIILIAIMTFPQIGAASCDDPVHNYSMCIQQNYPENPNACACCVISTSCDLGTTCPASCHDLSHCSKPIGILIDSGSTTVTNGNAADIVYSSDGQLSCNVGILVNNYKNPAITHVNLNGVTVRNWADGIMFVKTNNGGVFGSTLIDNQNGVYLFNSKNNQISSNTITDNAVGIYLDGPVKTSGNTIYNNYFKNAGNVGFNYPDTNIWNTTTTPGVNILGSEGGPYLGGNYWADDSGNGWSEDDSKCSCNSATGFCANQYTIPGSTNIDKLPLCKPSNVLMFSVTPSVEWHNLQSNYVNTLLDQIIITVTSSTGWTVQVQPSSDFTSGKMRMLNGQTLETQTLEKELQIGDLGEYSFKDVTDPNLVIASGESGVGEERKIDLRQEVVWADDPGDYRITLVFTASVETP